MSKIPSGELRDVMEKMAGGQGPHVSPNKLFNLSEKELKDGKWEYPSTTLWHDQ